MVIAGRSPGCCDVAQHGRSAQYGLAEAEECVGNAGPTRMVVTISPDRERTPRTRFPLQVLEAGLPRVGSPVRRRVQQPASVAGSPWRR